MKRMVFIIICFLLLSFLSPNITFAQDSIIKISAYSANRSGSPFLDNNGNPFVLYAGSTNLGTSRVGNFLLDQSNFGDSGTVPCSVTFSKPVDYINKGSLVDPNGKKLVDVFFATDTTQALSNEEINELKKFVTAGGILYAHTTASGGDQYTPLFDNLGANIHFW